MRKCALGLFVFLLGNKILWAVLSLPNILTSDALTLDLYRKLSVGLWLLLLTAPDLLIAQKLVPLRVEADSAYTDFPFYDDFSEAAARPDTSKWMGGSGAYINLHYG